MLEEAFYLMFLSGCAAAMLLLVLNKWKAFEYYQYRLRPYLFGWDVCYLCIGFWLNTGLLAVYILLSGANPYLIWCALPAGAITRKIAYL